ncbi:MAG: hypothetical protein LBN92_06715 [Treponema sp.]|jgi:hypothetical protein|nr:hypothetical protein [Treponema sp.]
MTRNLTTERPLLGRLVKYTVRAVLLVNLFCIGLYVTGSYRGHSDASQLALVRSLLTLGVLLGTAAFYGMALDIVYIFSRGDKRFLPGVLGYLGILVFGALTAVGSAFILSAVGGNR